LRRRGRGIVELLRPFSRTLAGCQSFDFRPCVAYSSQLGRTCFIERCSFLFFFSTAGLLMM
jgi:hypothetical protein